MNNFNLIKNKFKYFWLKSTSLFNTTIFLTLLLLVSIIKTSTLNNIFNVSAESNWQFYILKIFLILILFLIFIASLLWSINSFKTNGIKEIKENHFLSLLLVTLTINIYGYFFISKIILLDKNTNFERKKIWAKFKNNFGIKPWLTVDYVLIGFFVAITLLLSFLEENLIPKLPFSGGIALKYIPLMLISYTTSFLGGWLAGLNTSIISLLFIPSSSIINPWSFILDYFLPMTTPAIIAFFPFKKQHKKTIFTYINYFLHCFTIFLLIYLWQFLSGYFLWVTLMGPAWSGFSGTLYSLVYNFIHIFIFTYPITQIIIPIIYRSLGNYYLNKYH